MLVKTKHFGEVDLDENKVVTFEHGIMGFEDYTKYAILYDLADDGNTTISWLQSLEEPGLALPVIDPLCIKPDYNPIVEDDVLSNLGKMTNDNMIILLTLNIPSDITNMTTNLKAPIIINSDTCKGCQIIVQNTDYEVKFNAYDAILKVKEERGEM